MNKLTYINISQKEANRKIWNSLMDKYVLLKEKNIILAYLWIPIACILFGFVAVFSWLSLLVLLFKNIQFYPHYMKTEIEYNQMTKEQARDYINSQLQEYKKSLSYGNISLKDQSSINAAFDLLSREYEKTQEEALEIIEKADKPKESKILVRDLQSTLENWQLDILAKCINELRIFIEPITSEKLQQLFLCNLEEPIKLNQYKNKLLAHLFCELEFKRYISNEWQAICAQKALFISYKDTVLTQNNYSSTVYDIKENPPKDSDTIGNYIKQLKRP